jgi:hypothetical protein
MEDVRDPHEKVKSNCRDETVEEAFLILSLA